MARPAGALDNHDNNAAVHTYVTDSLIMARCDQPTYVRVSRWLDTGTTTEWRRGCGYANRQERTQRDSPRHISEKKAGHSQYSNGKTRYVVSAVVAATAKSERVPPCPCICVT